MMTRDQIKSVKAEIARKYPIEGQLRLFMEKVVGRTDASGAELAQKLRVAKFLCDKADKILVEEMDVRGSGEVLKALAEVEAIRKDVTDLLAVL